MRNRQRTADFCFPNSTRDSSNAALSRKCLGSTMASWRFFGGSGKTERKRFQNRRLFRDEQVDPVGACVGHRGMRRADGGGRSGAKRSMWYPWSGEDPEEFVANALRSAKVTRVEVDEEEKVARVGRPDHQLPVAIGRRGRNAALPRSTVWKIDIEVSPRRRIRCRGFGNGGLHDGGSGNGGLPRWRIRRRRLRRRWPGAEKSSD